MAFGTNMVILRSQHSNNLFKSNFCEKGLTKLALLVSREILQILANGEIPPSLRASLSELKLEQFARTELRSPVSVLISESAGGHTLNFSAAHPCG